MKKTVVWAICALVLMLISTGCQPAPQQFTSYPVQGTLNPDSGIRQWSTTDYSIVLTYPHTWFASTDIAAVVQLLSPLADKTPDYREYIIVGVMQPKEGDTDIGIADRSWQDMKEMFPSIELTQSQSQTVAGYNMQLRVFGGHIDNSAIGPEGDYIWYQYSFIAGGLSYSITFAGTQDMLEDYLPVFEYVLDTMVLNV